MHRIVRNIIDVDTTICHSLTNITDQSSKDERGVLYDMFHPQVK